MNTKNPKKAFDKQQKKTFQNALPKSLLFFIASAVFTLGWNSTASCQDFQFDSESSTGTFGNQQASVQTLDTEAFKRRAQREIQQQITAMGYPPEYSTQGLGDFFKPGKKKLIELIKKVIPPAVKPFIPELPDLKLGKKPKLIEILSPNQKRFFRDGANVYKGLYQNSRADLDRLQRAIKRKDGKAATRILATLMYKHNPLANRLRAARALGMRSVTISVSGGGAYFIGADGTHGIAIDIDSLLDPTTRIKASWYATVAVSGGAQVGASVSLDLGFITVTPSSVKGLSYEGRLSGTFAAGVGVSIAYDPVKKRFLGGTLGINTGAEVEASFAMGHTEVIKNFTIAAVLPPTGPGPDPIIDPGPDPIIDPIPGPQKSLGIYSTMMYVASCGRQGERIDQVAPGSAAARAGLEVGDIIVSAGGRGIANEASLRQAIAGSGSQLNLQVVNVRNGQIVAVTVRF